MTLINMKNIILLLVCCFIFGCNEYIGIRVCKKDTNNCESYLNKNYKNNMWEFGITDHCKLKSTNVTVELIGNPNDFIVFTCKDYDFYPLYGEH